MKKQTIIFTVLLFLLACNNDISIQKEYNKDGNIKKILHFHVDSGMHPFLVVKLNEQGFPIDSSYYNKENLKTGICYSKEDSVKKWIKYKDGYKHGNAVRKFSDGFTFKEYFLNDSLLGVSRGYDSLGRLRSENFWLRDTMLMKKRVSYIPIAYPGIFEFLGINNEKTNVNNSGYIRQEGFYYRNKQLDWIPSGALYLNSDNKLLKTKKNSYFMIESQDTITYGNPLNVEIYESNKLFPGSERKYSVTFLEIKTRTPLLFKKTTYNFEKSDSIQIISFSIDEYLHGYNIVWGTISTERQNTEIPFYLDFYVK